MGSRIPRARSRSTIRPEHASLTLAAFRLVDYVLDPNGREWIPIETFIGSVEQLEGALHLLIVGKPRVVDFVGPNGDLLNMGLVLSLT